MVTFNTALIAGILIWCFDTDVNGRLETKPPLSRLPARVAWLEKEIRTFPSRVPPLSFDPELPLPRVDRGCRSVAPIDRITDRSTAVADERKSTDMTDRPVVSVADRPDATMTAKTEAPPNHN